MKNHNLFGPFLLIAAGALWLLISASVIPVSNLRALVTTWPLLLIAAGVGLILQPRWPLASTILSGVVVAALALAVVFAPQLGWDKPAAWTFVAQTGGSVRGSGVMISETREVPSFDAIHVQYPVDVIVVQGETPSITIEGEDNLLPQLETSVSLGTLTIENSERAWNRRVNPTQPVTLRITAPDLNAISIESAGTVSVSGFRTDDLSISISGAGEVNLSELEADALDLQLSGAGTILADGSVEDLSLRISGLGTFEGEDLQTSTAEVHISGAGQATLWVQDDLDIDISGTGTVKYYGAPDVSKRTSGVSSIDAMGAK